MSERSPELALASPSAVPPAGPLVLLVDDDGEMRAGWTEWLTRAGFRVAAARTGFEAIVKASCILPDVILMDLCLPGMTGCQATELLKTCPLTRHIPVLAITGQPHEDSLDRAREAGCSEVLTKPCSIDRMLAEIGRALAPPPSPSFA